MTDRANSFVLALDDGPAVRMENAAGSSPILLICDHASNRIPSALGSLELGAEVLESHAAWDPGAYELARRLSASLDAALISSGFSRLVIDVNRPPDSPEAIRAASEVYDIPANQALSEAERRARTEAVYRPFHDAIDGEIGARAARGEAAILVSIHSFTPVYHGKERRLELGILHDADSRLADRLLACAGRLTAWAVERNQPYGPADGVTHTLAKHAIPRSLLNAMVEIRNDLIRSPAQQLQVAGTVADMLRCAMEHLGLPTGKTG